MNVVPVYDFENHKKTLTPSIQNNIRDLTKQMRYVAPILFGMSITYQHIVFKLDDKIELRFIFENPHKTLYVALTESKSV